MLRTSRSTESTTRPGKGEVGVGGDGGNNNGHDNGSGRNGQAHQWTYQLVQPRLLSSIMRLMVLASQSKSCQKIEELLKSPKNLKGLKSYKGHWFGGTFTKAPFLRYEEFELLLEL